MNTELEQIVTEIPTQIEPVSAPAEVTETSKTLEEYTKAILDAHQNVEEADDISKKKGKEAIVYAIKAGESLIEAKPLVGHGNWEKWLKENFKTFKKRTAERYMHVARWSKNVTVTYLEQLSSLRQVYVHSGAMPAEKQDKPLENEEINGKEAKAPNDHEIILAEMQRGFEGLQHRYDFLTKLDPKLNSFLLGKGYSNDFPLLLQQWQSSLSDVVAYFGLPPIANVCVRCGHVRGWDELFVPISAYYYEQHLQSHNEWCEQCDADYDYDFENKTFTKKHIFEDLPNKIKELTDNLNELKFLNETDLKKRARLYTLIQKFYQLKVETIGKPSAIKAAEKNVWTPADINNEEETIAAIQNLSPTIVIATGEADRERWNIYRHIISSAVNNPTIGKKIQFLVVDDSLPNKPVLGIGAINSDFPALAPRDEFIGWTKEQRDKKQKEGGTLGNTAVASTVVATPIFGSNFLGAKLIGALTTSEPIRNKWKSQYGQILAGMTTTSLFGVPSFYDQIKQWERVGLTKGGVPIQPKLDIYNKWIEFLKESRTYQFKQLMKQKDGVQGPITNYKAKVVTMIYKAAGLNPADFMHGHKRGIYFSEFCENTKDFLCGRIKEDELKMKPLFQETVEQITDKWRIQAIKRYKKLKREGTLKANWQSFSQLGKMDFETARKTFIGDLDEAGGEVEC